jgi:hypothetical protein
LPLPALLHQFARRQLEDMPGETETLPPPVP